MRILCVCGARPNFVKVAALLRAFAAKGGIQSTLVHTGQHYDRALSGRLFDELDLPEPDVNLDVGSASHGAQAGEIMKRFEPVCAEFAPDVVVVVGDVNSTLACAYVAVNQGVPVAHVEAGLRSFDRSMPEEINRILTDQLSDILFVTEPSGVSNLRREGIAMDRIRHVGNVMIDTLLHKSSAIERSPIMSRLALNAGAYGVITLHRASNVDDPETLRGIWMALNFIAEETPLVLPVHPRLARSLQTCGLSGSGRLRLIEPLGYLDFTRLMSQAAVVLTDSGGVQEETTALDVPCITLRCNTERPITLSLGTNRLAGIQTRQIIEAYSSVRDARPRRRAMPELWDGRAAERIADCLLVRYGRSNRSRQVAPTVPADSNATLVAAVL